VKFLCEQCKAKYQIADDKVAGKTVRMKCRKCGHLIEMRAEVTESSVATELLSVPSGGGGPPAPPRPSAKPATPRSTALAASFALPRPAAPKPERPPGALAGAFKSNVQREDESSAPFDMSELSPSDDWYVAINGVPVGPIRISEVRRKASLGAVTEDSLVWQEGLDEWRPLRSFPELAVIVRGALAGARISTPPPPEARSSLLPPSRTSSRPVPSSAQHRATAPRGGLLANPPPPRSNVVALTSRLATAERLEAPAPKAVPVAAVADALAVPSSADSYANSGSLAASPKKPIPWIPIAMVVLAGAFGTTFAIEIARQRSNPPPAVQPPAPIVVQVPVSPTPSTGVQQQPIEFGAPTPIATTQGKVAMGGGGGGARAAPSATSTGRSLDLSGLSRSPILPGEDPGSEGPKAPGQCFSEGQVQQVIGLHQVGVRRACWERNPTTKPTVNVAVALTIGPDGSAQGVTTTSDEPSVAKCIENDVRGWRFPAMGCSQKTGFSFKFVRQ
jgi:predicted Zn finger-like uncharacterized protein